MTRWDGVEVALWIVFVEGLARQLGDGGELLRWIPCPFDWRPTNNKDGEVCPTGSDESSLRLVVVKDLTTFRGARRLMSSPR